MKFEVGDNVRIIDPGSTYTTHQEWLIKYNVTPIQNLGNGRFGTEIPLKWDNGIILNRVSTPRNFYNDVYHVQTTFGQFLIGGDGLQYITDITIINDEHYNIKKIINNN